MTNAIAIARNLAEAGIDKQAAEAIAEVVVTHSDDRYATKADIIRVETRLNVVVGLLLAGVFVMVFVMFFKRKGIKHGK